MKNSEPTKNVIPIPVCELPRRLAARYVGLPLTLVLDNARYQRRAAVQGLAEALRIELLFLPAYSPNLNLIERLWKYVKKECLGWRVLAGYAAFTAAIDACLDNLGDYKEKLRTLMTERFHLTPELSTLVVGQPRP